ncbi:kelch-like protein 41a [Folsomia candida]|uniref:kelch-like protein 41a n=1 Tax=Folsomia candida TaxID=158441 RepID=UPI000B8FD28E|nr:kelch-like protein 41a [Folsomia candida]XP_035700726.1 kelch-like protein 41a [Folsomia candida]
MSTRPEKSEVRKPKWDWTGSHGDRLGNLLEKGFQSDFILDFRPQERKIPVHRIFLQAGSPVLNGRFKATMEELIIENVDTRVFKMLLKYLYTGKSGVRMGDALPLLQLATQYEVNGLRDECAAVLKGDLTVENVLSLFQSGMEYAHGDFIQSTLKFICKNARKILEFDLFANLRLECLIEIIQQDSLQVRNEMEVFEAVNRWGLAECTRQSLDPSNTENLRRCLAKPLNYVRFPLMNPKEFALKVTPKKLLNMEESMELLTSFLVPLNERNMLPAGRFVSNPRKYGHEDIVLTRGFSGGTRVIQSLSTGGANGGETIIIRVNEDVEMNSISVPKEVFDLYSASGYVHYYDLIKCTVAFANEVRRMDTIVCKFDTYESGNAYLRLSVNPPCRLNVLDGWIEVTIGFTGQLGFHQAGCTVANRQNQKLSQQLFSANGYNRVITNYAGLPNDPNMEGSSAEGVIDIKRVDGDGLSVNYGLIEKLEFKVI